MFEAERLTDGALFALKRLDRATTADEVAMGRFAREVRAASTVQSDHIVRVLDVGTEGGSPFLLMERLRGEDLGACLQRATRLEPGHAVDIARQVLAGLDGAHAAGVVHRNLKPDNIFLAERPGEAPCVKILDFGMSKIRPLGTTVPLALTRKGVAIGTPLYMSPEQAAARPDVDAQSDLYSVGAILFECLTGRPPHVGETADAVLHAIRTTRPPRLRDVAPELPRRLAAVVDRALAVDRTERFRSAEDMRRALAASLEPGGRGRRGAHGSLWLAGAAALAVGVMIAVVAAGLLGGRFGGSRGGGPSRVAGQH